MTAAADRFAPRGWLAPVGALVDHPSVSIKIAAGESWPPKGFYAWGKGTIAADKCGCGGRVMVVSDERRRATCEACSQPWPTIQLDHLSSEELNRLSALYRQLHRNENGYREEDQLYGTKRAEERVDESRRFQAHYQAKAEEIDAILEARGAERHASPTEDSE
jgi:hypothetical protein